MQNYFISWEYLPFNKTDTNLTYLDLLIISEENCSFDLNAMETFYECLWQASIALFHINKASL